MNKKPKCIENYMIDQEQALYLHILQSLIALDYIFVLSTIFKLGVEAHARNLSYLGS